MGWGENEARDARMAASDWRYAKAVRAREAGERAEEARRQAYEAKCRARALAWEAEQAASRVNKKEEDEGPLPSTLWAAE